MDNVAKAYKAVRDATVCNEAISNADKIGILEMVKSQIVSHMNQEVAIPEPDKD